MRIADGGRGHDATMKADGRGWGLRDRVWCKRMKARSERRRAKINPECSPAYGRNRGWLL